MTKQEILTKIEELNGNTKGYKSMSKPELQEALEGLEKTKEIQENPPSPQDPSWTEYVMSLFRSDELRDGMPTCDALRRVFRMLVGEIVAVEMRVYKSPTLQDPSATVGCSITYTILSENGQYQQRLVSDVFDVNSENTPFPYNRASVASAATKAEARAMRKALGLVRVYASEEVQEGMEAAETFSDIVSDENKPISDNAKVAITTMCQRLGVDQMKLVNLMDMDVASVGNLTYVQSHQVIGKLNEYSRGEDNGGSTVPETIKNEVIF